MPLTVTSSAPRPRLLLTKAESMVLNLIRRASLAVALAGTMVTAAVAPAQAAPRVSAPVIIQDVLVTGPRSPGCPRLPRPARRSPAPAPPRRHPVPALARARSTATGPSSWPRRPSWPARAPCRCCRRASSPGRSDPVGQPTRHHVRGGPALLLPAQPDLADQAGGTSSRAGWPWSATTTGRCTARCWRARPPGTRRRPGHPRRDLGPLVRQVLARLHRPARRALRGLFDKVQPVNHVSRLGSHELFQWAGKDIYVGASVRRQFARHAPRARVDFYRRLPTTSSPTPPWPTGTPSSPASSAWAVRGRAAPSAAPTVSPATGRRWPYEQPVAWPSITRGREKQAVDRCAESLWSKGGRPPARTLPKRDPARTLAGPAQGRADHHAGRTVTAPAKDPSPSCCYTSHPR